MFVDRILYPVNSLGPGKRIVIWVAGCHRKCPKCANPELWDAKPSQKISVERMAKLLNSFADKEVDGITISGGEPFNQAEELSRLIDLMNYKTEILIFSGYKRKELENDSIKNELLNKIDVLIDGEYVDELNDGESALRGSTNQTIHYINPTIRNKYETYLLKGRMIQNVVYDYKTISVGIHKRGKTGEE